MKYVDITLFIYLLGGGGGQKGAIKRGYDGKRQFYILVITLNGLSDIRAKLGKAKLMLSR